MVLAWRRAPVTQRSAERAGQPPADHFWAAVLVATAARAVPGILPGARGIRAATREPVGSRLSAPRMHAQPLGHDAFPLATGSLQKARQGDRDRVLGVMGPRGDEQLKHGIVRVAERNVVGHIPLH